MSSDDLDGLSTDELRQRALSLAEARHDRGFVWELARHMRAGHAIAGEDGSSGSITGTLAEAVTLVRELRGTAPLGDDEPLLRARFLDYLRTER